MRASSSFASSGTSPPRDARGRDSYGGSSGARPISSESSGEGVSAVLGAGTSTRFGRGGHDLPPGLIYLSVKAARMIRGVDAGEIPFELAVVGAGYVGLVTAACLSTLGFTVRSIDSNEQRVRG